MTSRSVTLDLLVIVLALASVAILILEETAVLDPERRQLLAAADLTIAGVFAAEWLWRLLRADDRKRFVRRSWWELLACIPVSEGAAQALRGLRLFRIVRIVRLLRVVRLAVRIQSALEAAGRFDRETNLIPLAITTATIVFAGAFGFHYVETGLNPKLHGIGDSVWWAIVTVTTIGYGDIYPVTTTGRVLAVILMLSGMGALGVFTAQIAAWIVRRK